jgi:hypothetical protein
VVYFDCLQGTLHQKTGPRVPGYVQNQPILSNLKTQKNLQLQIFFVFMTVALTMPQTESFHNSLLNKLQVYTFEIEYN